MNFFKRIISSRQSKANREIARMLQYSEFKNESYDYILSMIENGTIHERLTSR